LWGYSLKQADKMSNRVKLSAKSFEELNEIRLAIENEPANQMPKGSFYLYTPNARKKLDDIAWAVTYKLAEKQRGERNG
jgi:hypothetical protein